MKVKVSIAIVLGLMLLACKKEKKEETTSPTETVTSVSDKIKGGKWNCYRITNVANGNPEESTFDACEQDDYYEFYSSGQFSYLEGANVCSPSGAGSAAWSLSSDEKKLTMADDEYKILKLSADSMKLEVQLEASPGIDAYAVCYYKNIK